jgi:antitoxin component YwqK of YwqJK toxin-antitoxin module
VIFGDEDELLYVGNMNENDEFEGEGTVYVRYFGFRARKGNFKDGILNGFGRSYYTNFNENICYCGKYEKGLRSGYGASYYSNGKLKYRGIWINNQSSNKFGIEFNILGGLVNHQRNAPLV